jgi:uncharacterized membrane protein
VILDTPAGPPPDERPDAGTGTQDATAAADLPGEAAAGRTLALVQQCAWSVVWLGVLTAGLVYWGSWTSGPWAALLSPLLSLVALVGFVLVWTDRRPVAAALQWLGLVVSLVVVAVAQGTAIHGRHYYSTDSAAFNQVATRLLLDGHNPYTSSMARAADLLHPAAAFWTYQVDGTHTLGISYPAGSFLLQAPVMALGITHMLSDWVDLAAWLLTAVLVFCMLPRALRWLAPTLLLTGVLVGPFSSGGTDALFVPFLVLAVWRWDRWPGRTTGWLPAWVGPVSLGIACSVKQSPWFCVPFLVVGVACEARRVGRGGRGGRVGRGAGAGPAVRYGAIVLGTFLIVNLPFLIWSPTAWTKGTFLPMVEPLVADGQGVVALALHGVTGGVVLPWMSAAAGVCLVALVVAFALWETRLRRAWLFLVPLALFVPDRSLANYLTDFVPAALVAAASLAPVTTPSAATARGWAARRPWMARLAVGVPALAAAGLLVVAFTSAPLDVTVDGVGVAGVATVDGGQWFRHIDVTVHNTSDRSLDPRFMVSAGGDHPGGFWHAQVTRGSDPVAPGGAAEFTLRPTEYSPTPSNGQWWLVAVYTTSPDALSTSPLQQWRLGVVGH